MKKNKNYITKFMAMAALLLALVLSLTACGSNSRNNDSDSNNSAVTDREGIGQNEEVQSEETETDGSQETEQAIALTLADAEAKLICKNERCVVIAYYGPKNMRMAPYYSDGTTGAWPFGQYTRDLSSGWSLAYMFRNLERGDEPFQSDTLEGMGMKVSDRADENSFVIFENLEQMSETEMRAIGVPFLDSHRCLISWQTSFGGDNFCMIVQFDWIDEMSEADIEGFTERVSFFAGDSSSLDNYFDGYTSECVLDTNRTFTISLYFRSSDSNKEQNAAMIDELKASNPYMVYTGLDGETVKTNLSWE